MLRVGVVGVGVMGTTHIAAWAKTPAQFAGCYALDRVRAEVVAGQYGGKVYHDLDELIADVDVVDICTPSCFHHDMVLQAAAAGKQILCEKPLALSVADGREMVEACERAGVNLLVGHVVRFFPEYAQAKGIVERGEIGNVAVVRLTRASYQPMVMPDNWFLDPARSGGMMLDLMIHDFDYARWIAGDVESVFARSVRSRRPEAPGDYAIAILRHKHGAISNVEGGWAYPPPLFRTALEIAGDDGLIEHPAGSSMPLSIHLQESGPVKTSEVAVPRSPVAESPYETEIKHFYDVLVGNVPTPRVTAADALEALKIALAARQSAQTGRPVRIEEVA